MGPLLKDAGLNGYFTNHSLRRTCTTCLFQVGQSSKLVKEITGHISDAINKYQMSSEKQKMDARAIIQGDILEPKLSQAEPMEVVYDVSKVTNGQKFKLPKFELPMKCKKQKTCIERIEKDSTKSCQIASVIESAINAVDNRKAKLTIEVELLY